MSIAIVTGASRGIGKECAVKLASHYDKIAITCLKNKELLEETRNIILSKGCDCYAEAGDISDHDFAGNFINNVISRFGNDISLLVNNSGISYIGLLTDMDIDDWNATMNTNVTSVFNTCSAVVPHMVHNKSGRIINISSVWGITGASMEVAYSASKGAVNAFSKALAKELAPSNISVNAIAFGAIDTTMNEHLSLEEKQLLCDEIPYGRMATPAEAGDFICKIATAPEYLTGQIITFDGGWI